MRIILFVFSMSALTIGGCSGVSAPGVDVAGASVGEQSDEAFVIDFAVNLSNPNHEPLQLSEVRYTVTAANGAAVYRGRRSAEATLGAGGQKTILVPAVVSFAALGADQIPPSLDYSIRGELWYLAPGALEETLFDAGVQRPSVAFGGEGILRFGDAE